MGFMQGELPNRIIFPLYLSNSQCLSLSQRLMVMSSKGFEDKKKKGQQNLRLIIAIPLKIIRGSASNIKNISLIAE